MIEMATSKLPLSIAAAVTAFAFAVPASAGIRTTEVQVHDLDLARPSAQERLKERIDRAVRKVCRSGQAKNFGERQDLAQCEANARADAEAQASDRIAQHKSNRKQAASARLKLAAD
jgi:UrcA family protein